MERLQKTIKFLSPVVILRFEPNAEGHALLEYTQLQKVFFGDENILATHFLRDTLTVDIIKSYNALHRNYL
jgi:hypothetical protein